MFEFLKCKILSEISDIDFERPTGICSHCGHKTYMIKGSMTEDVCPWCKIMRLLVPLRLPIEVIEEYFNTMLGNKQNDSKNKGLDFYL